MLLNEFLYFDKEKAESVNDGRYSPSNDKKVLSSKDTRKTRLTLKQINQIRKTAEAHETEKNDELKLIQAQYAVPVQPPQ